MDKKRFIRELAYHLRVLPEPERAEIIGDYQDRFEIGAMDGKEDQEIILELDPPKEIAEKEIADRSSSDTVTSGKQVTYYPRKTNWALAIILIVFNLIFVTGPAAAIIGVLMGGWGISFGFTAAPLFWVASLFWRIPDQVMGEFFMLLTMAGIGILVGVGMLYLSKVVILVIKKYVNWMAQLVRG